MESDEKNDHKKSAWRKFSRHVTAIDCDTVQRGVGRKQSTDGAISRHGYRRGVHLATFEFSSATPWGSHCAVGVCARGTKLHRRGYVDLLGLDDRSWALDIPSARLRHRDNVVASFAAIEGKVIAKVVTMEIDLDRGRLEFTCYDADSKPIHLRYADPGLRSPEVGLHAAVSLVYGGATCTLSIRDLGPDTRDLDPDTCDLGLDTCDPDTRDPDMHDLDLNICDLDHDTHDLDADTHDLNRDTHDLGSHNLHSDDLSIQPGDERGRRDLEIVEKLKGASEVNNSMAGRELGGLAGKDEGEKGAHDGTQENEGGSQMDDADWTSVGALPPGDQALVRLAHAWDGVHRGGLLVPYPNAPCVCVPTPHLAGSIQAVRSRQGFTGGRHAWSLTELKFYSPHLSVTEVHQRNNDILVGVVSSAHRGFNLGAGLHHGLGAHAWCFQPRTGLAWHHGTSHQLSTAPDELDQTGSSQFQLDLDFHRATLSISCEGRVVGTLTGIHGDTLYPFVVFNSDAPFPVEISYTGGPTTYVEARLAAMHAVPESERGVALHNYRPLMHRSSSQYLPTLADLSVTTSYHWGRGLGLPVNGKTRPCELADVGKSGHVRVALGPLNIATVTRKEEKRGAKDGQGAGGDARGEGVMLLARWPLGEGRHKVQITLSGERCLQGFSFGFVAEDSGLIATQGGSSEGLPPGPAPSPLVLGSTLESWGWNVAERRLYHAGHCIATYPVISDLELEDYDTWRCRMIVSPHPLGYRTVSYELVSGSGQVTDLGIAFINVPDSLVPAVELWSGAGKQAAASVRLDYCAGNWHQPSTVAKSSTCTLI